MNSKKSDTKRITIDTVFVFVIYAVILAVWQIAYFILAEKTNFVKSYIFPNPYGVILTFVRLFETNILISAILYSLKKMFIGFFISLLIGIVLGLLIYIAVKVNKLSKEKKKAEADKIAAAAVAKAEHEAKVQEEAEAAAAFTARRSVDMTDFEENRRVAGASAVTGKDNLRKN